MTLAAARRSVALSARRIGYVEAGDRYAPAVVLLHGLASDSATWDRVVLPLAERGLHVLAVDLLEHVRADKPALRDLLDDFADLLVEVLDALQIPEATIVGHSLGGAIAMHFEVRHPTRTRRLVLVSAGGLGREVHPVLRAATLPIAPAVLAFVLAPRLRRLYGNDRLHRALRLTPDNLENLRRAGRSLSAPAGRAEFFASLRGVITSGGQRGSFIDTCTLSAQIPTLLVWNERDPVIPVAHARAAHEHLPGSRLVVFPGAGHEPHRRHAQRFADELASFVAST